MRGMRQMNRDMDADEDGGPSTNWGRLEVCKVFFGNTTTL